MKISSLYALIPLGMLASFPYGVDAAIIPAASVATNDVAKAIAAASNGDTITVPAGTAVWTAPITCSKAVTIAGAGVNTTVIVGAMSTGGGDPSAMSCLILATGGTNLARVTGISFVNNGTGGCGLLANAANLRVDNCSFSGFGFGTYFYGLGCVDHCTFSNNVVAVRSYGQGTGLWNWQNLYPIPFNSLNYLFVEDCGFYWDANYPYKGRGHAVCSAGQGSSYVVRYCVISGSTDEFAPAFDWHGDAGDGTHGSLSSQIYGNTMTLSGTAFLDKFVDARGGQGQVYSNTVVGAPPTPRGVAVREEFPGQMLTDPDPMDLVTNMWVWNNTQNGGPMPTFVDDATGLIKPNVQYFTTAPATLLAPPYPHPLVGVPKISVTPPQLNFGLVSVGSTNTVSFTVRNVGNGTLVGTATATPPFSIVGNASYSLGSNASKFISLVYVAPLNQVGTTNATVTFTGGGGAVINVSASTPLKTAFNSTDGTITAPFAANTDGTISQNVETLDPSLAGSALYSFTIGYSGQFVISAKVSTPAGVPGSFFVNIDSLSPAMIWDVPVTSALQDEFVTTTDLTNGDLIRKVWNLTAGTHQLIIRGRSAGTELGQISVLGLPPPPPNFHVIAKTQ